MNLPIGNRKSDSDKSPKGSDKDITQGSRPQGAKKSKFAETSNILTKKQNFHRSIIDESELRRTHSPKAVAEYNLQRRHRSTIRQGQNFETSGSIFNQSKCCRRTKNYLLPQKLKSLDILDPNNTSLKNSQGKSFDTDVRDTFGVESPMQKRHGNSQRAVLNAFKLGKSSISGFQSPYFQCQPDSRLNVRPTFFITQYR